MMATLCELVIVRSLRRVDARCNAGPLAVDARRVRPVSSLVRGFAYYACPGGAAPTPLLRDRRRGTELRSRGRAVAHCGPVAVPADQGARTGPEGQPVRPGSALCRPDRQRRCPAAAC